MSISYSGEVQFLCKEVPIYASFHIDELDFHIKFHQQQNKLTVMWKWAEGKASATYQELVKEYRLSVDLDNLTTWHQSEHIYRPSEFSKVLLNTLKSISFYASNVAAFANTTLKRGTI